MVAALLGWFEAAGSFGSYLYDVGGVGGYAVRLLWFAGWGES